MIIPNKIHESLQQIAEDFNANEVVLTIINKNTQEENIFKYEKK